MYVNVYTYDDASNESLVAENIALAEVLDASEVEEIAAAKNNLGRYGRHWVGGGAAPLFLLMLQRPRN